METVEGFVLRPSGGWVSADGRVSLRRIDATGEWYVQANDRPTRGALRDAGIYDPTVFPTRKEAIATVAAVIGGEARVRRSFRLYAIEGDGLSTSLFVGRGSDGTWTLHRGLGTPQFDIDGYPTRRSALRDLRKNPRLADPGPPRR